jgi:hypothetical protein
MRPLALIRLPDNCTRTDSIRLASCARQVNIADQELLFASDGAGLTGLR